MFKFLRRIIILVIIVAIAVPVVSKFLNTGNKDELAESLAGTQYSWIEEESNVITGYSCDVTHTMIFLDSKTVRVIADGQHVWKKGSNAYPEGKTNVIDYDYETDFFIEKKLNKILFKYTNMENELVELEMTVEDGKIVKIGKYSKD